MTITVNGPNDVTINFPDGTDHATIDAVMRQATGMEAPKAPAPAPETGSTLKGAAKALGVGVGEGVIQLAGLPADLADLTLRGVDKIAGTNAAQSASRVTHALGSENIKKTVEGVTGEFYKPQGTAERVLNTAGQFAPLALTGPGGIARRVATNVVAPTVGTETAGALTEGTAAEPYARAAGALTGGITAAKTFGKLERAGAQNATIAAAPTVDELKDAARAQYNHPEVKNVQIKPQAFDDLRTAIVTDLESGTNAGFRRADQPKTFNALDELVNPNQTGRVAAGGPMTVADLSSVRQRLGRIATEHGTPEAAAASRAIEHINDFLPNLRQSDLLAGNAKLANAVLSDARGNWGAAKRAQTIGEKIGNAELMAASTYGGGNINNATRQQFRPMLMNDAKKAGGYSPAALDQLNRVVKGGFIGNTARQIGRMAPVGPVGAAIHGASFMGSGGMSVPFSIGTYGAKKLGEAITRREVGRLDALMRADSPLGKMRGASQNPQSALAALSQSDSPIAAAILRALLAGKPPAMLPVN